MLVIDRVGMISRGYFCGQFRYILQAIRGIKKRDNLFPFLIVNKYEEKYTS